MDVRQLRYFSAIVDAKSFTKAADRVRVAQPALGLQIKKLEEELGVSLLRRHSRGVEPTEAGVVLLRHANAILKQIEQARQEVTDLMGPPRGEVLLGLTPTASALLAVRLVEACSKMFPQLSLNITVALSENIMPRLDNNSMDMGFTYNPEAVTGIVAKPLLAELLYLVGPAGAISADKPVTFAEVCKKNLILPSRGFGMRERMEETAREQGRTLDITYEIDSVSTMQELVEAGLGWTVLPYATVQRAVGAGRLSLSQISRPEISRTLSFAFASAYSENNSSRAVRQVVDHVIAETVAESDGRLRLLGTA